MKRNKFSLSHRQILTANMGKIIPAGLTRVLPGDSFRHNASLLIRLSPLLAPVMHPLRIRVRHFFVPDRIVWEDSEAYYTGGDDGLQAPVKPYMTFTAAGAGQVAMGDLADYYGLPLGVDLGADRKVSAIPFRGMVSIYNEHYRNTQLQTLIALSKASGLDSTTSRALLSSNWGRDYFTTCTPEAQLGADVTIPLAGDAPVNLDPTATDAGILRKSDDHSLDPTGYSAGARGGSGFLHAVGSGTYDSVYDPNGTLLADLSAVTGITIRQLRESAALQKFLEAQNIHGSRYSQLLAQWGVRYSDARLQRPELLGSSSHVVQVSEVLQTGVTNDGDPDLGVGNMRGHGIAAAKGNSYISYFEEHGYVHTLLEVIPDTMYTQGLHREWTKQSKVEEYIPQFAHAGDQEVLNQEVYAAQSNYLERFGFNRRYEEYRGAVSTVHGQFRTDLAFWNFARAFGSDVALNSSFVTANPTKEPFQVTDPDEHCLWIFVNHSLQARRIVSANAEPGMTI